ncbi:MAG: P-loop NTPase [Desulfobulbaceae bacterium]|nr:P-loop NTPase [Desulfobulbaceae bacterium]HIJ80051.1 P-loop NTPase [Deltaproteobacteria bacterium]
MALTQKPTIIPVASGKGGVGKSVFAASLAIALARQGQATIALDLDLGGSNLHTYLGLPNTNPGIGDFLKRRLNNFQQLIVPTTIPNLQFLPGDGKTPFMANIPTKQRYLLLDEIMALPARYVIVDLGAGTSINTMNFFGLANNGIMVTTLDTPAMMNALVFLRNFMFANIVSQTKENPAIQKMVLDIYRHPTDRQNLTAQMVYDKIREQQPTLARTIETRCNRFKPRFVFNMGDHPDELKVAGRIEATIRKSLSLNAETLGFIYFDDAVRKAVRKNEIFLPNNPTSSYARCLQNIVSRLTAPSGTSPAPINSLIAEARRSK